MSGTTRTGELRYRPFGVTRFTSGGSQYASHDYQTRLQAVQTQVSMRRRGNYYDNALMESFLWATLKTELVEEQPFASHAAARCNILLLHRRLLQSALSSFGSWQPESDEI